MRRTIREQQTARQAAEHGHPERAEPEVEEPESLKPLGQEAPEVVDTGARIGARRLARPALGDAVTAFIGGMSVSFGVVAMAWAAASLGAREPGASPGGLAAALTFPIGFIILLVGKSELFTENFFLPVSAVLERRGTFRQLGALWAVSLACNLLGGLVFAALISRPGVLADAPARYIAALAVHKAHFPFWAAFVQAIFAGWLMTLLTWLLVAAKGLGPRLAIIWGIGALIILGEFNHVVISACEAFIAMFAGAPLTPAAWFVGNFLPALAGNVVGGVVFVTLLFYIQARYHEEEP